MADAIQLVTDLDISSTVTKGPYTAGMSPMPVQRWFWSIKKQSGTGPNTLHIMPNQVANYEDESGDQQTFDLDDTDHFDYLPVITDDMCEEAGTDDTWRGVFESANTVRQIKFVFTYLDSGDIVFRFNIWCD